MTDVFKCDVCKKIREDEYKAKGVYEYNYGFPSPDGEVTGTYTVEFCEDCHREKMIGLIGIPNMDGA